MIVVVFIFKNNIKLLNFTAHLNLISFKFQKFQKNIVQSPPYTMLKLSDSSGLNLINLFPLSLTERQNKLVRLY